MNIESQNINQLIATGTSHIEYPENQFTPVCSYKESIPRLDSMFKFIMGYNLSVSSGELTREEFDTALRVSNDEHLQNMGLQKIYISDLHLFDKYLTAKDELHDKVFPKEWCYTPRSERDLYEDNPPTICTMPNGREVTSGFYSQVYDLYWEYGYIPNKDLYSAKDLLSDEYWAELNDDERLDAASCLLDFANRNEIPFRMAPTSTDNLILLIFDEDNWI
ncbi:MAG: hypothetical protein RLZZ508_1213 [Actinomycetota bacterium]|jgi:hypothetical protein